MLLLVVLLWLNSPVFTLFSLRFDLNSSDPVVDFAYVIVVFLFDFHLVLPVAQTRVGSCQFIMEN